MEALRLESSRDGGVFELDQRDGERWQATLTLPGLRAATDVDGSGIWIDAGQREALARAARSFDSSAGLAVTE